MPIQPTFHVRPTIICSCVASQDILFLNFDHVTTCNGHVTFPDFLYYLPINAQSAFIQVAHS